MKIYHKKNFATGLFFTLLGAAYILLFLVKGNIEPKSVVFCVLSLLLAPDCCCAAWTGASPSRTEWMSWTSGTSW